MGAWQCRDVGTQLHEWANAQVWRSWSTKVHMQPKVWLCSCANICCAINMVWCGMALHGCNQVYMVCMPCSIVWCDAISQGVGWHSTSLLCAVWHNAVWCGVGVYQHGMVWHGYTQCCVVWCSSVLHCTMWCGKEQHNMEKFHDAWCRPMLHGVVHDVQVAMWFAMVWCGRIWQGVTIMWYDVAWCSVVVEQPIHNSMGIRSW